MNPRQFNSFIDEYLAAFPATAEWLQKQQNPTATLKVWARTLRNTPLEMAAAVLDRMIDGDLAPVPAYERDQTALHVRACAARIKTRQAELEEAQQWRENSTGAMDLAKGMYAGRAFRYASTLAKLKQKGDHERLATLPTFDQYWASLEAADRANQPLPELPYEDWRRDYQAAGGDIWTATQIAQQAAKFTSPKLLPGPGE